MNSLSLFHSIFLSSPLPFFCLLFSLYNYPGYTKLLSVRNVSSLSLSRPWLSLALSGSFWLSLALCGSLWLSLALSGSLWLSLALSLSYVASFIYNSYLSHNLFRYGIYSLVIKASDYACRGRDPVQASAMFLNKKNFQSLPRYISVRVSRICRHRVRSAT